MNQRQRFIRKIAYACAIAALLLPLSWLSQPSTSESDGGKLAQMRQEYQLGQANLGEIDPASQTIKLATLGLQCVAFNILWEKANHYRKVEDWSSLSATLEQMTKLEPNYVSVWIFQGWNLSYNISVEFDNYKDRYHWVIRGIDYLKEGTSYNKDEPRLMSEIGWFISQKIGRADEHLQYRRLFRDDDEFNGALPRAQRDNWLVGRQWFLKSEQAVERGASIRGKNPTLFHSHPAMCLIDYAESLEEEGTFGEVAKNAWRKAAEGWTEFSQRDLPTLYNLSIRVADRESYVERSNAAQAELAKQAPIGLRDKIKAERLAALSEVEREAYDTPPAQRSREQTTLMYTVASKLDVSHIEVADRTTGPNHAAALRAAEEATQCDLIAHIIAMERDTINYDYWRLRCEVEPDDATLLARKLVYDGDRASTKARIKDAPPIYEQGFQKWREVIDGHPKLLEDANLTEELVDSILRYQRALDQIEQKFPDPFVLQDVVDLDAEYHTERLPTTKRRIAAQQAKEEAAKRAAENEAAAPNDAAPTDAAPNETGPSATPATEPPAASNDAAAAPSP